MSTAGRFVCMPCNPDFVHFVHHERCLRYRRGGTCDCTAKYHDNPDPPDAYRGPLPADWPPPGFVASPR